MKQKPLPTLAWALALGLAVAVAAPAAASPPAEKEKKVERLVWKDKDGKEPFAHFVGQGFRRGFIGVGLIELTPELREHFGVKGESGVLVSKVEDGSPADKAGLKVGDVITGVDGEAIKSSWDISGKIRKLEEGEQAALEIVRGGRAQNVSVTVEKRDLPAFDMAPYFLRSPNGEQGYLLKLDREKLLKDLPEVIQVPKWRGTLENKDGERFDVLLGGPRSARELALEKRLKELEKRLGELEQLLEKK
jgi:membrane-associated protease RseP (regulator of RpoE activity)